MPFLFDQKRKIKMKQLFLVLVLLVSACAQLMHGQEQPVIQKSVKEKIFFTTCSGGAEDWQSCNMKAGRTCNAGYIALNRFETVLGGRRELTFQCK